MIPDISDALIAIGTLIAGVGLWFITPWAVLVLVGVLLIAFGFLRST